MSRSKTDWPATGAALWRGLYEGLLSLGDLIRQIVRRFVDAIRGAFGVCDHSFTMTGEGVIVSRDLYVVMLGTIQSSYSKRYKYQIRCRCCKKIVAHRGFDRFEILGI